MDRSPTPDAIRADMLGDLPADDARDLAPVLGDLRDALCIVPSPNRVAADRAAMVAALDEITTTGLVAVRSSSADVGRSLSPAGARRHLPRRRAAAVGVVAAGTALVAFGGAASAGALPDPVQDTVAAVAERVGVDVPRGSANGKSEHAPGQADKGSDPARPGRSEDAPGQVDKAGDPASPGRSEDAPGHAGDAPGHAGDAPGPSDEAPGRSGAAPGQVDNGTDPASPGRSEDAPGQSGTSPGNSGDAPGQSGGAPGPEAGPGNSGGKRP